MWKFVKNSIARELRRMASSRLYMVMMIFVPIGCTLFFLSLLSPGLPLKTPAAVVDLDQSEMSRQVTRNLNASELVNIKYKVESYDAAMRKVRQGEIFGFFLIPANFQEDAIAGRSPSLEYFSNMTYFVPGTLSFKGFKTISVTTSGGVVSAKLTGLGLTPGQISSLVQPVVIDAKGIGNPWTNYSYYLTPSFSFATLALIIMLFTAYSITVEIKHGTSPQWLEAAGGSMGVALMGKLLPQSAVFIAVGVAMEALMFGFFHFPLNCSPWVIILAMALFVPACQAFATLVASALPNPRLSLSVLSLIGVLTFSFAGFSFPVEKMYGAIAIFSYIVPVRYLFLIYVNSALNGFHIYFVRYYFAALLAFLYLAILLKRHLKGACLHPVYVP